MTDVANITAYQALNIPRVEVSESLNLFGSSSTMVKKLQKNVEERAPENATLKAEFNNITNEVCSAANGFRDGLNTAMFFVGIPLMLAVAGGSIYGSTMGIGIATGEKTLTIIFGVMTGVFVVPVVPGVLGGIGASVYAHGKKKTFDEKQLGVEPVMKQIEEEVETTREERLVWLQSEIKRKEEEYQQAVAEVNKGDEQNKDSVENAKKLGISGPMFDASPDSWKAAEMKKLAPQKQEIEALKAQKELLEGLEDDLTLGKYLWSMSDKEANPTRAALGLDPTNG